MLETKRRIFKTKMRRKGVLPRVVFVSAGQSPRDDIMLEVLELTDRPIEIEEIGALDGLDETELELMAPGDDDQRIFTRLEDGTAVVVAAAPLEIRIANICAELDSMGYDLIVVLSTGLYSKFRTLTPLLHAQQVMDTWFASISMTECNLGVIHLLKEQAVVTRKRLGGMMKIQTNCVLGDRSNRIEQAARKLKQCDLIILNSVSYGRDMAGKIGILAGRPIVTARNVLANALRLHLIYLSPKSEHHLNDIEERLLASAADLTAREREIVHLAVQGLSNKEAGLKLGISHRTVEKHRASAMNKLGVSTISGLMRLALMLR
jgi:protein AroM